MTEERNWKRIRERLALHLPVRVKCRETSDFEWTEMTRLHNVTPFGAGFALKRPTEKGRLLHMTIPMPRQLRVFDHLEDQYRVWSIVRYVKTRIFDDKQTLFDVGVAFIGKRAPASYQKEPWKRYDVLTTEFQASTVPDDIVTPMSPEDQNGDTRHNMAVDMRIEVVDVSGEIVESEHTVTEHISSKRATLFTTLKILQGRFIRLTNEQYGVRAHAVVRARNTGADGVPRIHVEFIDTEWPL